MPSLSEFQVTLFSRNLDKNVSKCIRYKELQINFADKPRVFVRKGVKLYLCTCIAGQLTVSHGYAARRRSGERLGGIHLRAGPSQLDTREVLNANRG